MNEYQQIKLQLYGDSPLQANNEVIMNLVNINTALHHQVVQLKEKHLQEVLQFTKDHFRDTSALKTENEQATLQLRNDNGILQVNLHNSRTDWTRARRRPKSK